MAGFPRASLIPRDGGIDSTLRMMADPYRFISKHCNRFDTDVFATRLMFRRAICAMGEEAAQVFYHADRFTRRGAIPVTALLLLQDKGSAATLDGEAHRVRKQMLTSLMSFARIEALADAMSDVWREQLPRWERMRRVVIARDVREILCRAVCSWAGVPLSDAEAGQRTRELGAMYEGAGAVGPRNWWGQLLRTRTERWARTIIT